MQPESKIKCVLVRVIVGVIIMTELAYNKMFLLDRDAIRKIEKDKHKNLSWYET